MRAVDIITKKRLGEDVSKEEIQFLLSSYLDNTLPDYQMSAYLMAVVFRGMKEEELLCFTETMSHSGDRIDVSASEGFILDKHSTGGVGDKTSIALAPLLASLDIGVAKLSGRGLGHTGGTIDKFESIQGFNFTTVPEEMIRSLTHTGIGLLGYSDNIVPLDKKLYSLRDVTSTVQSIPLISSSIMSKKLAINSDAILLDVKVGNGAFMQNIEEARALARTMYAIGKNAGRRTACLITNMDQPLGNAVGNSLELIEAIETLKGKGPQDFTDLVLALAGTSLFLKGTVSSAEEGVVLAKTKIATPAPLEHLAQFIEISGGNKEVVHHYDLLPQASQRIDVPAPHTGYITGFDTIAIGNATMVLGAGRATKEDKIDHAVGLVIHKKIGDPIQEGESMATIHYNKDTTLEMSTQMTLDAISISTQKSTPTDIVLESIL